MCRRIDKRKIELVTYGNVEETETSEMVQFNRFQHENSVSRNGNCVFNQQEMFAHRYISERR